MLIGLTGLYCAGKNYVAAELEKRGFAVLDVDITGHKAIETEKQKITDCFGNDILASNGSVNRLLLGKKVFGKPRELALLESIVHPEANRLTLEWIASNAGNKCVINAALLHKSSALQLLDCIIYVRAPLVVRMLRAMRRDKLKFFDVLSRIKSQKFSVQLFKNCADMYYIDNVRIIFFSGLLKKSVGEQIDKILKRIGA